MTSQNQNVTNGVHGGTCLEFPELRRLNYFFGQMLGVQDFQTEQSFFREKQKLHNRCLHGYGVVCGLLVEPVPIRKDCNAKEEAEERELWNELEALLAQKVAQAAAAPAGGAAEAAGAAPGVGAGPVAAAAPALGVARAAGAAPPGAVAPAAANVPAGGAGAGGAGGPGAGGAGAGGAAAAPADLDAQIETLRRKLSTFYRDSCREEPRTCVRIDCGLALDCHGNELIVRRPLVIDLAQMLSATDYQRVKQGAHELYISLCHCEQAVDPVRPVLSASCGATPECMYGKWQEDVRVLVTVDPPPEDGRCETCCEPCADECLLLARINCFFPGHELHKDHIYNDVRRPISLYPPVTITGVSWRQGHYYTPEQARHLMGTHDHGEPHGRGLEIRFSRPVHASTIHRGVIDTWVIEGGRGRAGNIYNKTGELIDHPKDGFVDRVYYCDTTDESLQPGDRVLVILRTDFILDRCCRPVAGTNIGGRVPVLHEHADRFNHHPHEHDQEHQDHHHVCCVPPRGYGPWTSGHGTPGGTFESWFFIREKEHEHHQDRDRDRDWERDRAREPRR
jgi:hypothetical protein